MEEKIKETDYVYSFEKLNLIKQYLNYSIGNIESNFELKLPSIIIIIEDCINNCNNTSNDTSNNTSNNTSIIKKIYKKLIPIIGKDYIKKYKNHEVHKISYCIIITTYHLYVFFFPEKININRDIFYQLYPNFTSYQREEQRKLFNFYKCCIIFKNIIEFKRNFGFIFDSIVFIVSGSNKKYTRGGGAGLETQNRSKILFDVYGEVKKPSMRHIKNIFNYDVISDISNDKESNDEESNDKELNEEESSDEESSDEESSDEESYDGSLNNEEYIYLKKLRVNLTLFDSK